MAPPWGAAVGAPPSPPVPSQGAPGVLRGSQERPPWVGSLGKGSEGPEEVLGRSGRRVGMLNIGNAFCV